MVHSRKQRFLRLALCVSVALLFLTVFSIVPQKTAHAMAASYRAPCWGTGCNGRNPYTYTGSTGYPCAGVSGANWYVVATGSLSPSQAGYLQVWYSASCNVNWGRIVAYAYDGPIDMGLATASLYDENIHGKDWQYPTRSGSIQYCDQFTDGDCSDWYSLTTAHIDQISNMYEIDDNACFYAEVYYGMVSTSDGWACQ